MKTEEQQAEQGAGKELDVLITTGTTESGFKAYFRKHGEAPDSCYLCKRAEGDTTLSLKEEGDNLRIATNTVKLQKLGRKVGDTVLVYNICIGCLLLLDVTRDWTPRDEAKG